MFNEILTGKATLEARNPAADPHTLGAESVPDVSVTCARCTQTFTAKANATPLHCGACNAQIAQENAAQSARVMREAETNFRKAENSHRLIKTLIFLGVAAMLGFIRYQMRSQMREDHARAAGYSSYDDYKSESSKVYPSDEFSYEVDRFADEMCSCSDLACARDVRAKFSRYTSTHSASDDKAADSASENTARLLGCQAKFE